ncbi:MAG: DNA alkylation repair protein [Bacteroidota bacterium]
MKKLSPSQYLDTVIACFEEAGRPEVAEGQMKYMRNQFEFFGLKAPVWMPMAKQLFKTHGILRGEELRQLARLCFEEEQRELHYFAIEMVERALKKEPEALIDFLEELIGLRSWWDTVDWLAKLVGIHFQRFPALIRPVTERWMDSEQLWLQRTAIIFQLRYRDQTDADLLFEYILRVADSKEFFLQKAAGWALRQYAKTNPEVVRRFIAGHQLPALTVREGSKYLK